VSEREHDHTDPVEVYLHCIKRILLDVKTVILKTINITYTELLELDVTDVADLYQVCRDIIVQEHCFLMGLQGIDYRNPSKCGTDYYQDYLLEMERREGVIDYKAELMNRYNLTQKIPRPEFLIENDEGSYV
jgi:hypothetical protein